MSTMDPQEKLRQDVKRFLEVYRFLSSDGKAQFEAQMAGELKGKDGPTKELYYSLLAAAREGQGIEQAIERMARVPKSVPERDLDPR